MFMDWMPYIVKMSMLSNLIYRVNKLLSKSQWPFFKNGEDNPKVHIELQGPPK